LNPSVELGVTRRLWVWSERGETWFHDDLVPRYNNDGNGNCGNCLDGMGRMDRMRGDVPFGAEAIALGHLTN
jgi:hypothetical protein